MVSFFTFYSILIILYFGKKKNNNKKSFKDNYLSTLYNIIVSIVSGFCREEYYIGAMFVLVILTRIF